MKFQYFTLSLALLSGLVLAPVSSKAGDLTVVSWGGKYTKSQEMTIHKPYEKKSGHKIKSENYIGGNPELEQIRAQVHSGNVKWDIVDVETTVAIRACEEDLLEIIDFKTLPAGADGTPAVKDFIQGALQDCAVASVVTSQIYAYRRHTFSDNPPTKMSDFFDLVKYPGTRGLRKGPKGNLEIALIADGVPADKVYEVLGTPEGVDRAFKKLDTIKNAILWWESGSTAAANLYEFRPDRNQGPPAELKVAMTTAYNSRIFDHAVERGHLNDIQIVWDGQIYDFDFWVIPRGTEKLETALDFLKFSTATQQLAAQTAYGAYGPARRSSESLVGKFHNKDVSMLPYLPTAKANLSNAIQTDTEFWADNIDMLTERYNAWLAH